MGETGDSVMEYLATTNSVPKLTHGSGWHLTPYIPNSSFAIWLFNSFSKKHHF
jgi:hypothetical protein